jgi:hypothetical protein
MNNLLNKVTYPLGDDDIENHLTNPTIIKYSELKKYNDIEDLLPHPKSYAILLYETDKNTGHWTCVMKDNNNNIIYYDSYGKEPSEPLKWNSIEKNIQLGQDKPYLNILLDKTELPVYYNGYQFQNDYADIATCGRYTILFIKAILEDISLSELIETFKTLEKRLNVKPDLLVSKVII